MNALKLNRTETKIWLLISVVLSGVIIAKYHDDCIKSIVLMLYLSLFCYVGVTDYYYKRIYTVSVRLIALIGFLLNFLFNQPWIDKLILSAVMFAMFFLAYLICLVTKKGMLGGGDVRLLAALCLFFNSQEFFAILIGSGFLWLLTYILYKRKDSDAYSFGEFVAFFVAFLILLK